MKENATNALKKLELLFTVVNMSKAEFYMDLLGSFEVNAQFVLPAAGTIPGSSGKRSFGIEDTDRAVIVSVIREDRVRAAMNKLEEKFRTVRDGKGIAYTVPMSGTVGVAIYRFLSNNRKENQI